MGKEGHDEVDQIIAEWHEHRPELDTTPFSVFSRISRIARHMDKVRRKVFADVDLEPWGFDVLSTLRRSGKPYSLTPGQLTQRLLISSGTMTNRIDRLEDLKLVRRTRTDADRRAVLVVLTPEGQRRCDKAVEQLLAHERKLLVGLSADQQESLGNELRPLLLGFEADSTS